MSDIISGKVHSPTRNNADLATNLAAQGTDHANLLTKQIDPQINSDLKFVGVSHTQTMIRSAPLPTVEEFAGYEAVQKGSADRILSMAESAQDHRQFMDKLYPILEFSLKTVSNVIGAWLLYNVLDWSFQAGMSGNNQLAWIVLGSAVMSVIRYLFQQDFWRKRSMEPKNQPSKPQPSKTSSRQRKKA